MGPDTTMELLNEYSSGGPDLQRRCRRCAVRDELIWKDQTSKRREVLSRAKLEPRTQGEKRKRASTNKGSRRFHAQAGGLN